MSGGLPISNSRLRKILAIAHKELVGELRGREGLYTASLFAILTVSALGFSAAKTRTTPSIQAGLLIAVLLFSAIGSLARTFISEEEAGTGDWLRLFAPEEAVYWGKLAYNVLLLLSLCVLSVPLFVLFTSAQVASMQLLLVGLLSIVLAFASAISFCGALASQSNARFALAGVISIPVLLPVVLIAIGVLRQAFGEPGASGWNSVLGLFGLATAFMAAGPYLFSAVWKN